MLRIFLILFFMATSMSQYVAGESIWIGIDYAVSYTAIFEDVVNTSNSTESNTYRANGNGYGFHLTYKLNNYNRLQFQVNRKDFDLSHNSALLADVYNSELKNVNTEGKVFSKAEFYSYRFQYYKRFYPKRMMVGVGLIYDSDIENSSDSTIVKNTKRRLGGVITLGTEFGSDKFSLFPFFEYSFPITKYKEESTSEIHLGDISFGVRFSVKFL